MGEGSIEKSDDRIIFEQNISSCSKVQMCSGEGQALLCDIIIIARFLDDDGSTMTETSKMCP